MNYTTVSEMVQSPPNLNRYQTVTDDASIVWLEKAHSGKVSLEDIADALEEFKKLFKVGLASKAETLTLARAFPDSPSYTEAAKSMSEEEDDEPVVIGGPASVSLVDREGHLITTQALSKAFQKFMDNFRTRNAMILHSDVQCGWALPAYISKGGQIFKSGVDDKGLFFICELRGDTAIAKKVADQIKKGMLKSYSIAGSATKVQNMTKGLVPYLQVDDMELAEVTLCEKGVNQGASFEILKADIPKPLVSPSKSIAPARTMRMYYKNNGTVDFNKSFKKWLQKEKDPFTSGSAFATLHNEDGRRTEHEQLMREYGFPSEQSFESMRYVPVVETETDDDGIPIHNLPPWVVNEAGEALGDRLDEDSPNYHKSDKAKARQTAGSAQKMFYDFMNISKQPPYGKDRPEPVGPARQREMEEGKLADERAEARRQQIKPQGPGALSRMKRQFGRAGEKVQRGASRIRQAGRNIRDDLEAPSKAARQEIARGTKEFARGTLTGARGEGRRGRTGPSKAGLRTGETLRRLARGTRGLATGLTQPGSKRPQGRGGARGVGAGTERAGQAIGEGTRRQAGRAARTMRGFGGGLMGVGEEGRSDVAGQMGRRAGAAAKRGTEATARFLGEYAPGVGAKARREGAARREQEATIQSVHRDLGIGEGRLFSHPKFHGGNHAENRQKVLESMRDRGPKTVGEHLSNLQHLFNHNETGEKVINMQVNLPKGINHNTKMDNHEFSNLAHPDNGAIKYAGAGNFANHPGVDDHKMHILNGYRDPSNLPGAIDVPKPPGQIDSRTGGQQLSPTPGQEAGKSPEGGWGPKPPKPGYDKVGVKPAYQGMALDKMFKKAFAVAGSYKYANR